MGCNCGNKNKQQWEVVTAAGKVVYTSVSKPTATTVSGRYPESTVREKGTAPAPERWEVVGQSGSVLYTGTTQASADTVAKRHPASTVRKHAPAVK